MVSGAEEEAVREAAVAWVRSVTLDGQVSVTRDQLQNDFIVGGQRFPLVDRGRGIRRPAGWTAALSIMTAATRSGYARPYDDDLGPDGLHRYKLRRDERGRSDNQALRSALLRQVPLLWFYGIAPGAFTAIAPVYLADEERDADQFVVAVTDEQRAVRSDSPMEATMRRYMMAETKRRLHQPVFANQVMLAYHTQCAVCRLGHRELLDAAHIVPDAAPDGPPAVSNGLSLCKIHHAAYDRKILGIRPDYVVEIHQRLLAEIDGPMLRHGLQEHHRQRLMVLPDRRREQPDQARLEQRYAAFRAA